MAKFVVSNRSSTRLSVPAPVSRTLAPGQRIEVEASAADMDNAAIGGLIRAERLFVQAMTDNSIPDSIEVLPVGLRPEMTGATNTRFDLFVDGVNGSDQNLGTSYAFAFKTIQQAVDVIPENLYSKFGNRVVIHVAAGTYAPFYVRQSGVFVRVVGDRRQPLATWPVTSVTFALKTGYAARRTANISAYLPGGVWSGTVNENTHWIEGDWTALGAPYDISGGIPLDSVSPVLESCDDQTSGLSVALHPFLSFISAPSGWNHNVSPSSVVELVGLSISSDLSMAWDYVFAYGCRTYHPNTNLLTLTKGGLFGVSLDAGGNARGGVNLVDSTVAGVVSRRRGVRTINGNNTINSATFSGDLAPAFITEGIEVEARCDIRNVDFESVRRGIVVRRAAYCNFPITGNGIKVQGTPNRVFLVQEDATVTMAASGAKFTGATAGISVVIDNGTIANAKAMCSTFLTNSTTPSQEIKVGGNTGVLFSALPRTDYALGNTSTGSRAT